MNNPETFLKSLSAEEKQHGGHRDATSLHLLAGKLTMIYREGGLNRITYGKNEIIRMICSALRDSDWITIEPSIVREEKHIHDDSFKIEFDCIYKKEEINFSAHYSIEGRSDSSIVFTMAGQALGSFAKNRIGFCVLHPAEGCAGEKCLVTHTDNETETLEFPEYISPHQLFKDIRSMTWSSGDAVCKLDFGGDIFETEDQRNWTDASYKTYCTPLELPFPVKIKKGTRINQSIVLKVDGDLQASVGGTEITEIRFDPQRRSDLPLIGTGRSTRHGPLSENECQVLREVMFDHYRVDLYLFNNDWKKIAVEAYAEARLLGYPLELALFFDDNAQEQAAGFIDWISSYHTDVNLISLYHKRKLSTPALLYDAIAPLLRMTLPSVKIACGTNASFAQLNRERPVGDNYDFICYSIHPQEHASDNETLAENLKGQAYTVESARHLGGSKGIWVSPVNISRRFNANREAFEVPVQSKVFPSQADSRLMSLFGAGWTAGSIKYLGEAGVRGITFYETAGERGIIQGDHNSRWPDRFRAVRGMFFPVYHLFRYLLSDKSYHIISSKSSEPLKIECLALSDDSGIRILLVSFSASAERIRLGNLTGVIKMKCLNADNYDESSLDRCWTEKNWETLSPDTRDLVVEPYSITFIRGRIN